METTIAGQNINLNPEGYLLDLNQWSPEIAEHIAQEEGIELGEEHWPVLKFLQEQHRQEVALSIRKVGKSGIVNIKEFYALFPGGPLKKASRIAGIPKPASCI